MEQIQNLIPPPLLSAKDAPTLFEMLDMRVDHYNRLVGSLTGYQCSNCLNKGVIALHKNGDFEMKPCSCMKTRETLERIHTSGLSDLLRRCSFQAYETSEPWQEQLKNIAVRFAKSDAVGLFFGGQTGCGKTHLCTAVVGYKIRQGMSARYLVWRDDSPILKSMVNDPQYATLMNDYKQIDCLYIDDLFKTSEHGVITDADVKLAFELIDYRARNQLCTIISTQLTDKELIEVDEALAGRIRQMSKGYQSVIPKDRRKNYRLR